MNWDHAVSWGRGSGLALAILVGLAKTEMMVGQPELKKIKKRVSCYLAWVVVRQNHPCVANRRVLHSSHPVVLPAEEPPRFLYRFQWERLGYQKLALVIYY